jgi:hypothetical protein
VEQDIKTIPLEELLEDLVESARDAERCGYLPRLMSMTRHEMDYYGYRKEANEKIITKIRTEIGRRIGESNGDNESGS